MNDSQDNPVVNTFVPSQLIAFYRDLEAEWDRTDVLTLHDVKILFERHFRFSPDKIAGDALRRPTFLYCRHHDLAYCEKHGLYPCFTDDCKLEPEPKAMFCAICSGLVKESEKDNE